MSKSELSESLLQISNARFQTGGETLASVARHADYMHRYALRLVLYPCQENM